MRNGQSFRKWPITIRLEQGMYTATAHTTRGRAAPPAATGAAFARPSSCRRGEPMERLSATERLKALLPNSQPRSGNPLGDPPERQATNLLSPSAAITNAIQIRRPAAPTQVDHDG